MINVNRKVSARAQLLRCGVSTIVLGAVMGMVAPAAALAQDQTPAEQEAAAEASVPTSGSTDPNVSVAVTPEDEDAIIVTGQRRALNTSQNIKRNADTVVDSITATDIGAFPDKSVAEALQRVPGITVNRFAAASDTAHFSAEPSGVLVRGLPQVRSEFNGRDTFSANSSRGLSWGDISPELMAGVDTYKNQTAELIEGGIAGSINLRTRVPFDAPGQLIQLSATYIYGDLSEKVTPEFSGFYSNRWDTGAGEFGIMINGAYSTVDTRSQGIQFMRAGIFDERFGDDGPDTAYIPSGITLRDNLYERTRKGISAAAQWQSVNRDFLVTAQFNRSTYVNEWRERGVSSEFFGLFGSNARFRVGPDTPFNPPLPALGTPDFTFDEDGNFQSGTFNRNTNNFWAGNPSGETGWGCGTFEQCGFPYTAPDFASNDQGEAVLPNCYDWGGAGATLHPGGPLCSEIGYRAGHDIWTISRYAYTRQMTQDAAINLKWQASDRLRFNFDAQYVDADTQNYDIEINLASFTNATLDNSGNLPRVQFGDPSNINLSAGGLANPNSYYIRSVMDHVEDAVGQQWAFRGDAEYDIGSDWMDSLKFGARYADREQVVNWGAYNWQNIANTWSENAAYWNLDSPPGPTSFGDNGMFNGYPGGFYNMEPFGETFHGGNVGTFPFVPFPFLERRGANEFSRERIGVGNFIPVCERNGQLGGTPVEIEGSCFTPYEITDVGERTKAAYVMLKFGGPNANLGGLTFSGNIGVRFVQTHNVSRGFFTYPSPTYNAQDECPPVPLVPGGLTGEAEEPVPIPGQPPRAPYPAFCYLSPDDLSLASGGGLETTAKVKHNHFLPSFNLRVDLSPTWLLRFAVSRAMSRPDIGLLKNVGSLSQELPQGTDLNDPRWVKDSSGNLIGVTPLYRGEAYNPYLKPITAWQADFAIENYFAEVGSFTATIFYKKFFDYIQYGNFNQQLTRGGVTRDIQLRGPANGKGAEIRGIELAYQRFFDFLPAPLDGLGIQANYTFVDNKGVSNANLTPVGSTPGSSGNAGTAGTALDPGDLESLSKHSFNLVGMYEKGPLAVRLAYNWRSAYLVTAFDCCVYLPVWQEAAGFLDGTIRYAVSDNFEINLRGSNLLNTRTVLKQQVADEESPEGKRTLTPNAWFQNDRRFELGVRIKL